MNRTSFYEMSDKVWVLLTLAEIAAIDEGEQAENEYINLAKAQSADPFELNSYEEQKRKIQSFLAKIS